MATMRDVARLAGVSAKTVSRVFNDHPHVSPETRTRVGTALRTLGYVPNGLATAFRSGRAPIIGLVVPNLVDPFFGSVAAAAGAAAFGRGVSVSVTSTGADALREPGIVEALLGQSLTGLILAPVTTEQSYLRTWVGRTPIVFVDRAPTRLAADSFIQDDCGGALAAIEHLIEHGHRRIAFLGDALTQTTVRRVDGYRLALHRHDIPDDDRLQILGVRDRATADAAIEALDGLDDPPTAVFSSNDRTSMAVVPAVQRRDLALLSFGDFPMADVLTPSVTVVDQDPEALGSLAVERVFDRLAHPGRRFRRRVVVPVSLVERESCRRPVPLPRPHSR